MQSERVLFTFPGKVGDALFQWPIARQWAEENQQKIVVGLANQIASLKPLMEAQPLVSEVVLLDGVKNFDIGGQPFDFGSDGLSLRLKYASVFHLGFRKFPAEGLMRHVYENSGVPLKASFDDVWNKPSIEPFWTGPDPGLYRWNGVLPLVLHGNKSRPLYYVALIKTFHMIAQKFNPVVWAGRADEWPYPAGFEGDGLPLVEVAKRISTCGLVFAASSAVAALAGAQGAPCLRVGEKNLLPHEVWNNPGPRQYSIHPAKSPQITMEAVLKEQPWRVSARSLTA